VVVCEESWDAIDGDSPAVVQKTARHAWISTVLLSPENVHERFNLGARHRGESRKAHFGREASRLWVRAQFSYNWEAMRGYHFLMQIAHPLNILVKHGARLARMVRSPGVAGRDPVFARDVQWVLVRCGACP
jgi:hypothetical protein